jgi:hypothetical protein
VNVWPPIVTVADRWLVAVLAAALKATVPAPLPLAPDVTVSHAALLLAVQAQPLGAVTVTVPLPPLAAIDWLADESV